MAVLNALADSLIPLTLLTGLIVPVSAQPQTADEYQVKAAYMYNLAKFVEWPPDAFESPSQPIVFCVLGQTPLSQPLQDALAGKLVGQRPLLFRQLADAKDAGGCKVLFVGVQDRKRVRQILDQVKSLPILTVGDDPDFTQQDGIVRFYIDAGRVRLEINLDAADAAKLQISSKLLSLGRTMRRPGR